MTKNTITPILTVIAAVLLFVPVYYLGYHPLRHFSQNSPTLEQLVRSDFFKPARQYTESDTAIEPVRGWTNYWQAKWDSERQCAPSIRLRQLRLAILNYHDRHGRLPSLDEPKELPNASALEQQDEKP